MLDTLAVVGDEIVDYLYSTNTNSHGQRATHRVSRRKTGCKSQNTLEV